MFRKVAEEKISNIRTVRSFAKEDQEISTYRTAIDRVLKLSYKESLAQGVFWGSVSNLNLTINLCLDDCLNHINKIKIIQLHYILNNLMEMETKLNDFHDTRVKCALRQSDVQNTCASSTDLKSKSH